MRRRDLHSIGIAPALTETSVTRPTSALILRAAPALALAGTLLLITGCSSLTLDSARLSAAEVKSTLATDREALARDVEPLAGPLTMEGAVARAIKYNADRRYRAMEEAVAMGAFEVGQFDMLPKVIASAGYRNRSNDLITTPSRASLRSPTRTSRRAAKRGPATSASPGACSTSARATTRRGRTPTAC